MALVGCPESQYHVDKLLTFYIADSYAFPLPPVPALLVGQTTAVPFQAPTREAVHLTPVEYKIVAFLARNSGKVMTYSAIMSNIWGPYADSNNRILRVNMANIRRKLEKNPAQPEYIYTEVGVGYRMREDEFEAN